MVRCFSVCLLICIFSSAAGAQTLIWSDEFDDLNLDTDIWSYETGGDGFGNGELQYYTARSENIFLENGNLVIEARREAYQGNQFTSARIKTAGRMAFKYGTIEARIKVPDLADGLWPAFWLLGDNIGQVSWPACGEVDILEMGMASAIEDGVTNRRHSAAAHWDIDGNYAQYGEDRDSAVNLNDDFHVYRLDWTPQLLRASIDGIPFWTMDIDNPDDASLHEFHERFFIILNLAVGGWNFVDITEPDDITAPFPARMYIDYVRLYDNGDTEIYFAGDTAEQGNFGVFTETTPVTNSLTYEVDSDLFLWNNLTANDETPFEGDEVWGFQAGAGDWFGLGAYCRTNRNMMNYAFGNLRFHMKMTDTRDIRIGIASSAGGEGWATLSETGQQYGMVRDGQWHEVVIPMTLFSGVDFNTISQMFMVTGEAGDACEIAFDNIYWQPSEVLPTPENGSFGIFTETASHKDAGEMVLEEDGNFYVWENTLLSITGNPYEGEASMAFESAPGFAWFGASFTPNTAYNLTAFRYPESRLHFALKTSSTTTFQIGMKSGTLDGVGTKWITFENGSDPYGFIRDGMWHIVEIPMADFTDTVDLSEVTLLFQLLGTTGPISDIEFDDICFIGGGTAIQTGEGDPPTVNAGADITLLLPENSTTLTGSVEDTDGTVESLLWTQLSGPADATLSGETTSTLDVSDLQAGVYIFRLTATDNDGLEGSDNVVVNVNDPAPTANAGVDRVVDYPLNIVILQGEGQDVDGTIESYEWTFVDGPAVCLMIGASTTRLIARELIPGDYIFRLTVTDNDGLTGTDDVLVQVVSSAAAENLALNKPATASSQEGGYTPANAVDGSSSTRWGSAFEDPSWIMVDLQDTYSFNQVVLNWEAASSKVYDIEVSDDASNWTSIYHTEAGGNGIETLDIAGTGRYVRMYGTERNLPYGHSLWEFEIYGGGSIPGDGDGDGDVDLDDLALFTDCLSGPGVPPTPTAPMTVDKCLEAFDAETVVGDGDVDLWDYSVFMSRLEQ